MRLVICAFAAPIFLLSGCATLKSPPPAAEVTAADSAYGMFLAGSAALSGGHSADATKFLDLARGEGAQDPTLAERAFTAALLAGDIHRAAGLVPAAAASGRRPLQSQPGCRRAPVRPD